MSHKPLALDAYEAIAERFAVLAASNAYNACYERPATISLLPDVCGKDVLDAGCGPGIYAECLLNSGANVTAIDASPAMLKQARRRLGDRVSFRQANLEQPLEFFAAELFDVIILALVLDSVRNWYSVFRELFRLMKPGGVLVFSVGHPLAEFELSQTRNYFDVELIDGEWPTYGLTVPSYRRSFTEVFAPPRAAGFIIDRILEPLPTEDCRAHFPESFRKLSTRPYFLHARLIKP